jgi:TPR repeat protein
MVRALIILILSCSLFACATPAPHIKSELADGKRYFETGYYKRAMRILLPLACDGNPEAQYAVGYMYYYGLGVAQDTDVGYFWIKRAADRGHQPAADALRMISVNGKYTLRN